MSPLREKAELILKASASSDLLDGGTAQRIAGWALEMDEAALALEEKLRLGCPECDHMVLVSCIRKMYESLSPSAVVFTHGFIREIAAFGIRRDDRRVVLHSESNRRARKKLAEDKFRELQNLTKESS